MKIKDLTKEELEAMSYDDIAYMILKEGNKKLKLPELLKKVCKLLGLDDSEIEEKISEFFQLVSRDQRFIMLNKGYWDLKERHQTQVIITNDEEDEEELDNTEEDVDMIDEEDSTYYDEDNEDDDPEEDDLKDLVIISDDEEDEANIG